MIFCHDSQLMGKINDLWPLIDISTIFWQYLSKFLVSDIKMIYRVETF